MDQVSYSGHSGSNRDRDNPLQNLAQRLKFAPVFKAFAESIFKEVFMSTLVLVRHGQSQWNLDNKFTGWVDVPLTPKGEEEAHRAGKNLKGMKFDIAFTSDLQRAQKTLGVI